MSQKPNVLIFGGSNGLTPVLALFLVPLNGEPLVDHLRIADKYSMSPPTVYVPKAFPQLIKERANLVEYRQANLTNAETVARCFTDPAPNGRPYTHIFDLSGDIAFERPAEIQITHTLKVALTIAREAAQQRVKVHIRMLPPVYDHKVEKLAYHENDVDSWRPLGVRGVWWHEMIRAVASVPNLPLVVLREAFAYGPGYPRADIATGIMLGAIYKYLGQDFKPLWGPRLKKCTIHVQDVVRAAWSTALWASTKSRTELDTLAGVSVPPSGDKTVTSVPEAVTSNNIIIPVFNLSDDGDSDQERICSSIANALGMKYGYHNEIIHQIVKLKFNDVVEDANELHIRTWNEMYRSGSSSESPLSPYIFPHQFGKRGCALNSSQLKKVVGYTMQYPLFDANAVKETVDSFRAEGIWPQ